MNKVLFSIFIFLHIGIIVNAQDVYTLNGVSTWQNDDWTNKENWSPSPPPNGSTIDNPAVGTIVISENAALVLKDAYYFNGEIQIYGDLRFEVQTGFLGVPTNVGQLIMDENSAIKFAENGNISSTGAWTAEGTFNYLAIGDNEIFGSEINDLNEYDKPNEVREENLDKGGCTGTGECADFTPLPIELLYFTASPQAHSIKLEWASAREWNFSHYTIERSADGEAFMPIEEIYSETESVEEKVYHFEDLDPLPGNNYYRLKTTDIDKAYEYVGLVHVAFKGFIPFSVAPNPARESITINSSWESGEFRLLNNRGLIVYKMAFNTYQQSILLPVLPTGIYVAILISQDGIQSKRLVIQ